MAEFCMDCWNKLMGTQDSSEKYILSRDLELCEECGEMKPVIVAIKRRYIIKEWFANMRKGRKYQGFYCTASKTVQAKSSTGI